LLKVSSKEIGGLRRENKFQPERGINSMKRMLMGKKSGKHSWKKLIVRG